MVGRVAPVKTKTLRVKHSIKQLCHGFTLIELMVVLVISALLFVALSTNFSVLSENREYRAAVSRVISAAQHARKQAVHSSRPVDLVFEASERRMAVVSAGIPLDEASFESLPESLILNVTSAAEVSPANGYSAIRFYPMGGASGGDIELVRKTGAGTLIQIGWLLADVKQSSF